MERTDPKKCVHKIGIGQRIDAKVDGVEGRRSPQPSTIENTISIYLGKIKKRG